MYKKETKSVGAHDCAHTTKARQNNGITLIVLIITIIVMLILVAVTITVAVNGGLFENAGGAVGETQNAINAEQQLADGRIKIGDKWYASTDDYIKDNPIKEEYQFDVSTLTIGTAINANKYGWKVPGYTVTTSEFTTGVWRLFYQDSEYTYLITDELVGSYKPSEHYEGYVNGSQVSTVGQKLSPMISSLFTEDNTTDSIRATAWFTDTECWKNYAQGDAIFAIASPTVELFVASYNATKQGNTILLEKGTYGYKENTSNGWMKEGANHGIYIKSTSDTWWIASPYDMSYAPCLTVSGSGTCFNINQVTDTAWAVRPIVCIKTAIFNSDYASNMVDD